MAAEILHFYIHPEQVELNIAVVLNLFLQLFIQMNSPRYLTNVLLTGHWSKRKHTRMHAYAYESPTLHCYLN